MVLRNSVVAAAIIVCMQGAVATGADDDHRVPAPFEPFEYLVGSWTARAIPAVNRLKGWPETHAWAWRFEKGTPVGLTVAMKGDRLFTEAKLSYEASTKTYRLEGTDSEKKPVVFAGKLDTESNRLSLDRVPGAGGAPRQQITFFPNANFVRYSLWIAEKEPGAPQFKRTIDVNAQKDGETFAAGAAVSELPKCIVTGGRGDTDRHVSGKSYPLCCTGCKAEFDDNPEKYVKKAALRAQASATAPASVTTKGEGASDSVADEPKSKTKYQEKAGTKPKKSPDISTSASKAAEQPQGGPCRESRDITADWREPREIRKDGSRARHLPPDREGLPDNPRREDRRRTDQGTRAEVTFQDDMYPIAECEIR